MGLERCSDFFQQAGGGLGGFERGEFAAQFEPRNTGAEFAKILFGRGRRGEFWPDQKQIKASDAHEQKGVFQVAAGVNVVSFAAQEFPQVSSYISTTLNTEHALAGLRGLFGASGRAIEGGDRVILGFVRIKKAGEMRKLQHLADVLGHVAEFHVAACLARAGEGADHGPDAAAVDEVDLAKVKNDGAAVAQKPGDMGAQRFGFAAGDDASFAAYDGDAADVAGLERELHRKLPHAGWRDYRREGWLSRMRTGRRGASTAEGDERYRRSFTR